MSYKKIYKEVYANPYKEAYKNPYELEETSGGSTGGGTTPNALQTAVDAVAQADWDAVTLKAAPVVATVLTATNFNSLPAVDGVTPTVSHTVTAAEVTAGALSSVVLTYTKSGNTATKTLPVVSQ